MQESRDELDFGSERLGEEEGGLYPHEFVALDGEKNVFYKTKSNSSFIHNA